MSQLSLFKLIRLEVFFLGRFCQQFSSWVICIQARTYLDDLERFESEETEEEEAENGLRTKSQIIRKAVFLLIMGTIIAAVFADPLVDAVTEFSTSSHIPSFFISFVLLPLASNSNEAVSSILFSSRKKKRNMSLTYSQVKIFNYLKFISSI